MQPIKTTNAMNPAPAKGIESFPTPVIDDVVIAEVVNAWKGDYQKLEYGTLWKDVSHAPNQGSFPEHKLVFQQPASEDGQWIKRIWVNDRVNQDSYNYAIKYSAGSQQHPIYIRNYVVPRETYAPLPDGTPDPLFPIALLVDEEANRIEGELDSKYVSVTRVYETLPGPQVPTKRYNERGDLETVIVQTVPPFTAPDQDGLLVTQSQVVQEELGKGVKTTATVTDHALLQIKEKKEGLLGETITTDDIVSPSTNPDALSQTIVSSVVEQFSATKARKRTTTASGPTSLSQRSNDGKLIGNVTVTESVVSPLATPDAITTSILLSEVQQVDSGKAIKKNTVINSTPTLTSKRKGNGLMGNTRTVETVVTAGTEADTLNTVIVESVVEPINSSISRKATTTQEGPTSLVGGEFKEGLLGQTLITESIVTASSTPDQLSQTVVSSRIEPIDSAKSKKTTIASTGPTSLTQKNNDGKLLGNVTSTQSIVSPNANPDSISSDLLSSEVKQIDSGKAIKTNILLNSTPTLSGNQNEGGLLGNKRVVESIVPSGSNADALSQTVISSSVEAIDSARSKKTTVSSDGPRSLSGVQNKDGLLGQTQVIESIVSANSPADSVSLQVISSIVEPIDSAKSKKTTIISNGPRSLSGKENKGGLLGNTTTTESIVSNNSNPDQLSQTVISSTIQPIDLAKSKKTTITSNGPTSLISRTLADSPTGAVNAVKYNEIVNPNQVPVNSLTTLKYEINAIDSAKSEAEIVTVDVWTEVHGVEFDELTGIPLPYTEIIISPSEYIGLRSWNNASYKPIDEYKSLRKAYNVEAIQERFKQYISEIATTVQIKLPDKLIDATAYISRDYSEGRNITDSNDAGGDSYGYSTGGGYKSSGSISADIYFKIEKGFDGYINAEQITFFITEGLYKIVAQTITGPKITLLSIINERVSGPVVKYWPAIKKTTENILVFTGGKGKTTSFSNSEDVSINGFANSTRQDDSYDIDTNVNSIIVPDTLHEAITIKKTEFGPLIPSDLQITGGVQPPVIAATNPSKFPTGRYLLDSSVSNYKFGLYKVTAVIADITEDFV